MAGNFFFFAVITTINEFLFNSPVQALVVWGGLALLVILLFMREPRTLVLRNDEAGRLQISRHALHRLIETCCTQLKGVASARAEVVRKGAFFNTQIRLKIRPNAKLDAIQGYLQEEVADIFRENLGIKDVGKIEVKVIGVVEDANAGF